MRRLVRFAALGALVAPLVAIADTQGTPAQQPAAAPPVHALIIQPPITATPDGTIPPRTDVMVARVVNALSREDGTLGSGEYIVPYSREQDGYEQPGTVFSEIANRGIGGHLTDPKYRDACAEGLARVLQAEAYLRIEILAVEPEEGEVPVEPTPPPAVVAPPVTPPPVEVKTTDPKAGTTTGGGTLPLSTDKPQPAPADAAKGKAGEDKKTPAAPAKKGKKETSDTKGKEKASPKKPAGDGKTGQLERDFFDHRVLLAIAGPPGAAPVPSKLPATKPTKDKPKDAKDAKEVRESKDAKDTKKEERKEHREAKEAKESDVLRYSLTVRLTWLPAAGECASSKDLVFKHDLESEIRKQLIKEAIELRTLMRSCITATEDKRKVTQKALTGAGAAVTLLGIASAAVGVWALSVDGKPTTSVTAPVLEAPKVYSTHGTGIGLVSAGAAGVVAGAVMLYYGLRKGPSVALCPGITGSF